MWAPRIASWTVDRNWNRAEGERLLKARSFGEAVHYLQLAVAEADHHLSAPKRVRLRLQLAEAQRKNGELDQAEQTLRAGIQVAAKISDHAGYLMCLDSLADVFSAQGNYAAAEQASQEGIRIETAMPHPDPIRMARRVHRLGIARFKNGSSDDALPALEKGLELH